ncbi:hypothetical protein GJ744_010167 [Endocarpon pusillum]|uniref:DlpA domain-containing protein n=1 Tax=Endocarpon pusillum TaxID=364733 RepID=A0A8H7AEQ5_9EURO|nr:hypothetical protein GJ744_010167 [Endocarpon pusillum]
MEPSSPQGSNHFSVLSSYSACDVSDALLKLQQQDSGEILHAGYLADIVPYAPFPQHLGSFKGQPKVIGPASTLKLVARNSITSPLPESGPNAIPKGQHWVDLTDEGTVMVIEQPEGQSCAAIGGIMALRMKTRGAKGCVVGGRVRDLEELNNCGLPVWARGKSTVGAGAQSKVFGRNIDVTIGGVRISPGDIIFCDPLEGVVAIPRNLLDKVISMVPKLVAADEKIKGDLQRGGNAASAFRTHRG